MSQQAEEHGGSSDDQPGISGQPCPVAWGSGRRLAANPPSGMKAVAAGEAKWGNLSKYSRGGEKLRG